MSTVLYDSSDRIATITIDRPAKRNAIDEALCQRLREAWQRFAAGDDRVAIVTGAGEAAFCAGADLNDTPKAFWQCVPGLGVPLDKPVVAAISGWCVGGGLVIAMMADLAVATETARFVYPEAKAGIFGGVMPGLVSRMPHKVAMELMLVGDEIGVERAFELGFVNRIVPAGRHLDAAREYAQKIAKNAPLVVQTIKRFADATLARGPAERFYPDVARLGAIAASTDREEGAAAFREHREPRFTGK